MKKIILPLLLLLIVSCGGNENQQNNNYDVKQLRSAIINTIQQPTTSAFVNSINELNNSIVTFSNTTNQQNLTIVKNTWKKAATEFSLIEAINIGDIKDAAILTSLYSWNANETAIENYISSNKEINATALNSNPTNTRGLSAIEYLISEDDATTTLQQFNNSRRLNYLKALGENLVQKTTTYTSIWNNFETDFIENNSTGINGGINQVVNAMYALLEDVKTFKIGQPAGIEKTTDIDITLLQAEKSENSLLFIEKNIEMIERLYFGNKNGLDDYVFSITDNNELNDKLKQQFEEVYSVISKIKSTNSSLKEAVSTNKNDVQNLYSAVRKLLVLIKTDVSSTLSITITVTDNDGD